MSTSVVRFGLIGFGAWGRCHAEAIVDTDSALLCAIAAQSEQTCATAKNTYPNATVYSDYRRLLANEDLDCCVVVLPSHLHHEVGAAVLSAGRHLLLEKPMCLDVVSCEDLIERAHASDRLLAIGHELRLSSLWSKVKSMIDEGCIGEPQYVLVELSRNPYRLGADGWRYDIDRVGNWILEEPIHFFDFSRWYLQSVGDPVSVYARANARRVEHPELQDNFSALVEFPGTAYAVISQTLSMFEHHQTVKVAGREGSLWARWSGAMDRTRHPTFSLRAAQGTEVREIPIDKITGEVFELRDQVQMLVRAVQRGDPLTTNGHDGMWSVALCVAAQRSVEASQPIPMQQIMTRS